MGRPPTGGVPPFRFLASEVSEMERLLEANHGGPPSKTACESLAETFSNAPERRGQTVQWKQVCNWFQNKRHYLKSKMAKTPENIKSMSISGATNPVGRPPTKSSAVQSGKKENAEHEMEFEAKSSRDEAWYDVAMFLAHKLSASGEPEVRVRFAGFGSDEDEWVNVRTSVRQRSLPCEAAECIAVIPGDTVLCFQEGNEQALYYDAKILQVQRRRHDIRGCRCKFWVRYEHDLSEEIVPLKKVCRRPETEFRLKQSRLNKPLDAQISRSPGGEPQSLQPNSKLATGTSSSSLGLIQQPSVSSIYSAQSTMNPIETYPLENTGGMVT